MNLEGSVVLYKFSKIIVTDSPLEPKIPSAIGSWPEFPYQACISSCRAGFVSKQKVLCYPCSIHVTSSPVLMSCQISSFCSLQHSLVHKTVDDSFHTASLHVPSLKARHHKRSPQINSNFVFPCHTPKSNIFSSRFLPPGSAEQLRAMAITYIILGSLGHTYLTAMGKGSYSWHWA